MTPRTRKKKATTQPTEGVIPTVTCPADEYERLKAKAEIYDLSCGITQAHQRIAMLEQSLLANQ